MSVLVRAEVDAQDMARVARVLRSIDRELMNDLKRSMMPDLETVAKQIAAEASANGAPMSGMRHRGNTKWGPVRGSLSVTPGRARGGWGNLATMEFRAGKSNRGLYIAEFAGTAGMKWSKNPRKGIPFVEQLNRAVPNWKNGGRYIYRAFMPKQTIIYLRAQLYVALWADRVTAALEARNG